MGASSPKSKKIDVHIAGKVRSLEDSDWCSIEIVDLNATGLCMTGSINVSDGDLLEFQVPTALAGQSKKTHHFYGRVIWCRDDQYGVQFLKKSLRKIKV